MFTILLGHYYYSASDAVVSFLDQRNDIHRLSVSVAVATFSVVAVVVIVELVVIVIANIDTDTLPR